MDNHAHRSTTWPLRSRRGDAAAMPPALLRPRPLSGRPAPKPVTHGCPWGLEELTACGSQVEMEPAAPAPQPVFPAQAAATGHWAAPLPAGSRRGRPSSPTPRQERPARGSSARWARISSRGHCPGCEGEDTVQPPSAGIRHVRAAAEPPLPAEPAAPPPFRVPGTAGEGDRRHRRSVHPGARPLLPPRHRSHAALSAMLARRPLTLRPPPPTPSRVRGSRCPPARPPHCGPAPPSAPGDGRAPALTHSAALHLPPPVAAGLAPRRRAEKGQREERAPSPNLPRQPPPRYCLPGASPPFPGTTTTAPRPSRHCPEQGEAPIAPGRRR